MQVPPEAVFEYRSIAYSKVALGSSAIPPCLYPKAIVTEKVARSTPDCWEPLLPVNEPHSQKIASGGLL
jgi:hypothetical protein